MLLKEFLNAQFVEVLPLLIKKVVGEPPQIM
jgi:hypothetical protein